MARPHVAERGEHAFTRAGRSGLEIGEETRDRLALEAVLRPAQIAGEDRELEQLGVARDLVLGAEEERTDDDVLPVVGAELRGHRLQLTGEHEVQHQRRDRVVAVVSERDLGAAELFGEAIEDAAAEARAERAERLSGGDLLGDDRVGVLADHPEVVSVRRHVRGQPLARVAGVALIDVHRDDLEAHGRALREVDEEVMERVAVLAAGDRAEDAIALRDQIEIVDRARHPPRELAFEARAFVDLHRSTRPLRARGSGGT